MKHETWSHYWRLGELTTLNHFREGYTGELAEFWHRLVDALPEGGRVVDLATGNGAVAVAVLRHARQCGRAIAVEGVDIAQIDPVANAGKQPKLREELQAIRFHPATPLESTGLPEARYDLVTSQYGIEYGDVRAAIVEVARLLVPGGRFGAIVHSAESSVTRTAVNIDSLLTLLLEELDILGCVRALLLRVGDATEASLRLNLERAVARAQAFAARDHEMRMTTQGFLQRISPALDVSAPLAVADRLALIDQVEHISRGLQQRMNALRQSAFDHSGLEQFLVWLREAGLNPEPPQTIQTGAQREVMGYGVVARRAAA